MHKSIALISTLVVLTLVNWSIYKKEQHLKYGTEILLELVPVDPRSLIQGDYMRLRFAMSGKIIKQLEPDENSDGTVPVILDKHRVAKLVDPQLKETADGEIVQLKYRYRDGVLKFATNAFFFQEGTAELFENARYGIFKLDQHGELLMIDLAGEDYKGIKQSLTKL